MHKTMRFNRAVGMTTVASFAHRGARLCMLFISLALVGCGRTISWEEEVLLNTGEVIWVKRTDSYVRRSEPGNPLDMGWGLNTREIRLKRNGQEYNFQTESQATLMIYEYADTPKTVAIVAWTTECGKRGYGEYRWKNNSWQLQPEITFELVGRPRNLMDFYSATEGDIPFKVTQDLIKKMNVEHPGRRRPESHLLASRVASDCSRSK